MQTSMEYEISLVESLREKCFPKRGWLEWVQGKGSKPYKGLLMNSRKFGDTRNLMTCLRSSKKSKRHLSCCHYTEYWMTPYEYNNISAISLITNEKNEANEANEAVNVLATCLSNQMTSSRQIRTWHYEVVFVYKNGHNFIKRATSSLKFLIRETISQIFQHLMVTIRKTENKNFDIISLTWLSKNMNGPRI